MNEILEAIGPDLTPLITNLVMGIITTVFTILGYQLKKLMKKHEDNEKIKEIKGALERNKEIVQTSVEYVEQIGKHLEAEKKFELAKDKAVELANVNGFNISDAELDALIEQAVLSFKKGLATEMEMIHVPDMVYIPESEYGMPDPEKEEDEIIAP